MVRQFVDYFRSKEYGFNFFPVLGMVSGAVLGGLLYTLFDLIRNSIKGYSTSLDLGGTSMWVSSLFFSLCFLCIIHWTKRDSLLPLIYGLASAAVSVVAQSIAYIKGDLSSGFYENISFKAFVFNPEFLLFYLYDGVSLTLAVLLLYLIFRNLKIALLVGLPLSAVILMLIQILINFIRGLGLELSRADILLDSHYLMTVVIGGFLSGLLFYLGYILYMSGRGLHVSGGRVFRTSEDITPKSQYLSIKKYFGPILTIIIIDLILLVILLPPRGQSNGWGQYQLGFVQLRQAILWPLLVVSLIAILGAAAVFLLVIYRMWSALQDGKARMTPGRAVAFLFIPAFNLYWAFQVFYGFARDYNALADRHELNVPKLPAGLFLTLPILAILESASFLLVGHNMFVPVAFSILSSAAGLAAVYLACQAVNRIPTEIYGRVAINQVS